MIVSPLARYVGIATLIAFALLFAHDRRVDHLRGVYKGRIDEIGMVVGAAYGTPIKSSQIIPALNRIASDRDQFQRERDNARATVESQSNSILALQRDGERLAAMSARDRQLAEAMARQRDVWIARARAAETRTERLSAEAELAQCERVLDALYDNDF